jgi:hydroxylysine kinase
VPVPRVVACALDGGDLFAWNRSGSTAAVRCVTFLEGRPLADARRSPRQRGAIGRLLAELDLGLASFRHADGARRLMWDAHQAHLVRPLATNIEDPADRSLVEEAMNRVEENVSPRVSALRRQVIHNDFNPQNVLVSSSDDAALAGVIDFGDMLHAPRVQDLATACAYHPLDTDAPLRTVAEIAAGYEAITPLDADEIAVLPDLIAARVALSMTVSAWRAAEQPDNRSYLVRNQAVVRDNLRALMALPESEGRAWLDRPDARVR